MADEVDMNRLKSGEMDLSRCDFRGANLSGMDLRGRDFSHSLFEKAICHATDFTGSDFTGAIVSFIDAERAIFDGCILRKLHFGFSRIPGCKMRNAMGIGIRFQHAHLNHVDMSGADFSNGSIDADTILKDAIANEKTNFEQMSVLRSTARDPLFKDYEFKGGKLYRRPPNASVAIDIASNPIEAIVVADTFSSGSLPMAPASDRRVSFDHNDPQYIEIAKQFDQAIDALRTTNEHIDGRDHALASLTYGRGLWNRAELTATMLKVGIIMAIDDAMDNIGKIAVLGIIELLKSMIIDYTKQILRL